MVTDFREKLTARMVATSGGVKFLTTWIKEDLALGEIVEFSTSLLNEDDCEEQIYGFAPTDAEAKLHISLLMHSGKTTLEEEY